MKKIIRFLCLLFVVSMGLACFCACGHTHSYTKIIVKPTCSKAGYILYKCDCGDTIRTVLDPEHDYGDPTYQWDGKTCTATRVCKADASHVETETVTAVYVKDTNGTCTTTETGHYAATFSNVAFSEQSTPTDGVDSGIYGHVCEVYVKNNDATCMQDGTKTGQCTVCGETFTLVDEGTMLEHEFELVGLVAEESETEFAANYACKNCSTTKIDSFQVSEIGLPVISFTGSLKGISKTNKVTVDAEYLSEDMNFSSKATLKVQGGTSAGFPKKNYSIQFVNENGAKQKYKLVDSWGKESKYCLKANYIDFSQARNVVSGKLWGEIVRSRNLEDEYDSLPNGGAIDGYPVLIYLNGEYLGLYTLNIPKDEWMFDMDDLPTQAILFGGDWSNEAYLKTHISEDFSNGMELEYCATEETDWVLTSINAFIDFLNNSDDATFLQNISNYTNVDRAIDVIIYTAVLHANDNTAKNILWVTFDGVKWTPSVYDMDGTWGLKWDGKEFYSATSFGFSSACGSNVLFTRLWKLKKAEILTRYRELREDVLSISNIEKQFSDFLAMIPEYCYEAEKVKWTSVPSQDTNNYQQIISFAKDHLAYLDSQAEITVTDKADSSYRVDIKADKHAKVYYYETSDYTNTPSRVNGWCWSRNSDTGELTKIDGQVNFKVVLDEGYKIDEIKIDDVSKYKNLKTPSDTENENTYRITKISGNIVVTVTTKKTEGTDPQEPTVPEGYNVTFVTEHCTIIVYDTQDYTVQGTETNAAFSRDSSTGELTKDGGQCNFKVVCEEGYHLLKIEISGTYKNLKGQEETFLDDVYRVTKISSDLIITVSVEQNV